MEHLDKKSYIEHVAFDLFLNIGYDATSIRMICKEAKIDPPTLYNFFGSKKGLFFAISKKLLDQFISEDGSYYKLLRSLPPEMQLYSIFITCINFSREHVEETKFFFRYSLFSPKELQDEVREFLKNSYEIKYKIVNDILNECIKAKLIGIDIEQASSYFWNFVNNSSFNVAFENWRPSKEELLELWETFFECRLKGMKN